MAFKIVRNDITKMEVDVIVNTANMEPIYSDGVDTAVYEAAGVELLLAERRKIGCMHVGEVAITPGFHLPAKYIIHAVSPFYKDGESGEEDLLRSCYRKSLELAYENKCESIAFPLISTGSFGY
ncbi:MAG: macro domain-containing protein, partial [Lachnospiraceae bacterium]|nr:macro domain-containing protein [Lachnospiraceae bacterium]